MGGTIKSLWLAIIQRFIYEYIGLLSVFCCCCFFFVWILLLLSFFFAKLMKMRSGAVMLF